MRAPQGCFWVGVGWGIYIGKGKIVVVGGGMGWDGRRYVGRRIGWNGGDGSLWVAGLKDKDGEGILQVAGWISGILISGKVKYRY